MATSTKREVLYKLLIVGPSHGGKTSILRMYHMGLFTEATRPTIACDFVLKVVQHKPKAVPDKDAISVTMQIWDIAGQDHNATMNRSFYSGAFGAMIVVDVTNPASYEQAVDWKKSVDRSVFFPHSSDPVPCVLLINKCDLGAPHLNKPQLEEFCSTHGFAGYYEVSAKTKQNLDESFGGLLDLILERQRAQKPEEPEAPVGPVPVIPGKKTSNTEPKKDKCKC